ncbi:MAG TPA: 50S ribosomal protein L18 [Clostridiales bacterium]|nr:50S ribosomal protein L18 [Clostridiales bacterium]
MINKYNRNESRKKRHRVIRKSIQGTPERPRLNVFRSSKHIYAQLIDDTQMNTIVSSSTLDKNVVEKLEGLTKKEAAELVGKDIAEKAIDAGIEKVVFDRGGYLYHGRVKALAEGARENGLKF